MRGLLRIFRSLMCKLKLFAPHYAEYRYAVCELLAFRFCDGEVVRSTASHEKRDRHLLWVSISFLVTRGRIELPFQP